MKKELYKNRNWLQQKYVIEKKNVHNIAREAGIGSGTTIMKYLKLNKIPLRGAIGQPREKNVKWKGGYYINRSVGYKYVLVNKNHPRGIKKGGYSSYVPEQYLVMEKYLGRYLKPKEVIHHLNGNKLDNRIENLMLCKDIREHHIFEGKISKFIKQLIWDNLNPKLGKKVKTLFEEFIEEK